jgi:hypothetical protein
MYGKVNLFILAFLAQHPRYPGLAEPVLRIFGLSIS